MIISFSVQNFASIKEKQTLSFEADKSNHLENYYIINSPIGLRLLKLGLVYGANASGKTNILLALEFLRDLVLEPEDKKTNTLNFKPFLFDTQTPNQNSILSLDFIQNNIRYFYEIEFNQKAITREELLFFNPNKATVFNRTTDLIKQLSTITFGNKIKKDKNIEKLLESNTLWNVTVLGGFLKTNIELKELKDATDWFSDYLKPMIHSKTKLERYVNSKIDLSEIEKEDIINILKQADFHISDLVLQKEERDIPGDFLEFIIKQLKPPSERIKDLKTRGKLTSINLQFEHTVRNEKYYLPSENESAGTMRYYGFAGILSLLIKNSVAVTIDELESSLHPDLYVHFLLSFLMNSKNSQLIATTHNREIFNNKEIFRNDAIWFTDKSECCATELYSLSDFDTSVIRDTSNIYNAYKSGKLGAIPNLGTIYIDLNNESQ